MKKHKDAVSVASQPCRDVPSPTPLVDWRPEPCGLSREELREIVAEILG